MTQCAGLTEWQRAVGQATEQTCSGQSFIAPDTEATMTPIPVGSSLDALHELPQYPAGTSFGPDIDAAHEILLSDAGEQVKRAAFLDWAARHQPCVFGRMATKSGAPARGLAMNLCWISQEMLETGPHTVADRIAADRRTWKERAARGESSAFLVIFNSPHLARARPSVELAWTCTDLASLYLTERAPIQPDVIYTEAIPLRGRDGILRLFKGSVQLFHTGAHLRRHHDRRMPGGAMISVTAPGHYANSLLTQDLYTDLVESTHMVRRLAARSVGAGGLGDDRAVSTTWHRDTRPAERDAARSFSAAYQLDVLVQSDVVSDPRLRTGPCPAHEQWSWLDLSYIDAHETTPEDRTHGWFHGTPIHERDLHHNPWSPVVPVDAPDFNY
ncbi:hypothetical protein [Nocardia alni]|uniref:hypothetical protein n=1 Tax=Nocardia alni TaxID=2815723 RepID=UPI001C24C709|nr:hypothetical protein [Nocardia alni]